jgi:hypothetical protein
MWSDIGGYSYNDYYLFCGNDLCAVPFAHLFLLPAEQKNEHASKFACSAAVDFLVVLGGPP